MDKRIIKSRLALIKAYLKLKKGTKEIPLVKDVCKEANVNKTTFYRHYKNIDELILDACELIVNNITSDYHYVKFLLVDPEKYLSIHIERFSKYTDDVEALIDSNSSYFFKVIYEKTAIEYKKATNKEIDPIVLKFISGGVIKVLFEDNLKDEKTIKTLTNIIKTLSRYYEK